MVHIKNVVLWADVCQKNSATLWEDSYVCLLFTELFISSHYEDYSKVFCFVFQKELLLALLRETQERRYYFSLFKVSL